MPWQYRIFKRPTAEGGHRLEIVQVLQDETGAIVAWASSSDPLFADTKEGLQRLLDAIERACQLPVLEEVDGLLYEIIE